MRVLLIGARGQLGTDLVAELESQVDLRALGHDTIEVADADSVAQAFAAHEPDLVVNSAAYNRVDDAEDHPEVALRTNGVGPHVLAQACAAHGSALLHLSTDYVFSGDAAHPWQETDPTVPRTIYGISKLAGELAVRAACPRSYVVRVSGLFGLRGSRGKPGAGNFVETMLRLQTAGGPIRVVDDQTLAPTYTQDLASKLREVILTDGVPYGVYHMTASGACSWFEFAREIFNIADLTADLAPQSTAGAGFRAQRPRYSVLANSALAAAGIGQIRPWLAGLQEYLSYRLGSRADVGG